MSQRIVPGTDSIYLDDDGNLVTQNIDFQTFKAIAMVCDNGTTFPTSPAPTAGQWFYRSDLKILYLYQSGWQARISFGAVTMYVDGALGSDGISQGYGTGADAAKTIQYALNRVPPINGGNVTINVAAGTYNESLIIQGKYYTGNYSLIIQGVLSDVQSGTSSGDGVLGTGATQGSVLDAGNMAGHADKLIYLAADGDYRVIDSVDVGGDNATIVGTFTSKPLSGEAYVIKDWATIISGVSSVTLRPGQFNVEFYDIAFSGSTRSLLAAQADVTYERCKFSSFVQPRVSSAIALTNCLVTIASGAATLRVESTTVATVTRSKLFNNGVLSGYCIWGYNASQINITSGTILDCGTPNTNTGITVSILGAVVCYSTAANGYCRIRNAAIGISTYGGGVATNTSNNQYSGNTADETAASAPDWGYID